MASLTSVPSALPSANKKEEAKQAKQVLKQVYANICSPEDHNTAWDDIVGHKDIKSSLKQKILLPLQFPSLFNNKQNDGNGILPLLLYGSSGVGKSMMMSALVTNNKSTHPFIEISDEGRTCTNNELVMKAIFTMAREHAPCVVVLDDVKDLDFGTLLNELNDVHNMDVQVILVTNKPYELEAANVRRRFLSYSLFVPLPNKTTRKHLFQQQYLEHRSFDWDNPMSSGAGEDDDEEEKFVILATLTEEFSCADICAIVQKCLMDNPDATLNDLVVLLQDNQKELIVDSNSKMMTWHAAHTCTLDK